MKTVAASIALEPGSVKQFEYIANDIYSKATFLNASPGPAEVSMVVGEQVQAVRIVSVAGFAAPHRAQPGRLARSLGNLATVSLTIAIKPGDRITGVITNNSTKAANFQIFLSND